MIKLELPPECLVIMMIYVERAQKTATFHLSAWNWRPLAYTALMLTTKIWDDLYPFNFEFSDAYRPYSIKAINEMEIRFLEIIDWKMYIDPDLYSRYYWALKNTTNSDDIDLSQIAN